MPSTPRLGALLAAVLLSLPYPWTAADVPGETGTCSSKDGSCLADEEETSMGPLVAAVLLSDGVRAQLVRPDLEDRGRALSELIRVNSPIMSASLAPGTDGQLLMAVVTFDGQAIWCTVSRDMEGGGPRTPLVSMGSVQQTTKKRSVTALALGHSGGITTMAMGHQDGKVSVWHHRAGGWVQISDMRGSHHLWEEVVMVSVSNDGRVLLGSTGDNVALWRLPADLGKREHVEGQEDEPPELRHLHGGNYELSGTAMGELTDGRYIVVVAFTDGTMEGWLVPEDGEEDLAASVLWKLGKIGRPRVVAVAASSTFIVAGDVEGVIRLWKLDDDGELVSKKETWKVRPSESPQPAGSLVLMPPSESSRARIAVTVGNIIVVLDAETGREVYKRAETGSPLDLIW